MKTVKKVVTFLIAVVVIGACDPIDPKPQYKNVTSNKTNFHLEASATANIADPQEELHLEFTEIANCNVAESIMVVLDSKLRILNERSEFMVREGNIDFLIHNSGCYMVAYFDGKGIISDDGLVLNATIDIEYGTGTFLGYEGELSLKIVGVRTQDQLMNYTIEIDSKLENRIPKTN
jgi:hypothetical protein